MNPSVPHFALQPILSEHDVHVCLASELPPQIHVGAQPTEASFKVLDPRDEQRFMLKPHGGLWTSSLAEGGTTGWVDWCRGEDFGGVDGLDWWIVEPDPDVLIAVIDSADDLVALVDAFPKSSGYDFEFMPSRYFDFHAMHVDGIAGVRLTERGLAETRWDGPLNLRTSAWDCESTVWLRWCFRHVRHYRAPSCQRLADREVR